MDAIFQNVWEMSLFVIPVVLVFALCSNLLGKRYGAKWRYLLWLVMGVRLCIPVQIDLPEPMMRMQMEVPSVQNGARELLETKNPNYLMISIEPLPNHKTPENSPVEALPQGLLIILLIIILIIIRTIISKIIRMNIFSVTMIQKPQSGFVSL